MSAPPRASSGESPVNLDELTKIELLILKRMREFTMGEHRSTFNGTGFDFVGIREWLPGDRTSAIDWPQSTLTNFSPLMVRDFEQPSTATVVALADTSLSTRCGMDGVSIEAAIARAVGTIGMSAVFFQDTFGLITFDAGFANLDAVRPRIGKGHVVHCLEAYQRGEGDQAIRSGGDLSMRIAGFLRRPSLVPVISDFLFDDTAQVVNELAMLNGTHDVFLVLIDSAFAFDLPPLGAGWVEAFDVETGRSRVMSRRSMQTMADRMRGWQDEVRRLAHDAGLDVVRVSTDDQQTAVALTEFIAERRLRKR
ncbi:MAG: DUF58 domain-containing protein [Acidobacteriota bacterium]